MGINLEESTYRFEILLGAPSKLLLEHCYVFSFESTEEVSQFHVNKVIFEIPYRDYEEAYKEDFQKIIGDKIQVNYRPLHEIHVLCYRGIVTHMSMEKRHHDQEYFMHFEIEFESTLSILKYKRKHRVFSSKSEIESFTVNDLVEKLVYEAHYFADPKNVDEQYVTYRYPDHQEKWGKRYKHKIQYNETHFEFMQRMFSENGLYYYFENDENKETLHIRTTYPFHQKVMMNPQEEDTPLVNDGFLPSKFVFFFDTPEHHAHWCGKCEEKRMIVDRIGVSTYSLEHPISSNESGTFFTHKKPSTEPFLRPFTHPLVQRDYTYQHHDLKENEVYFQGILHHMRERVKNGRFTLKIQHPHVRAGMRIGITSANRAHDFDCHPNEPGRVFNIDKLTADEKHIVLKNHLLIKITEQEDAYHCMNILEVIPQKVAFAAPYIPPPLYHGLFHAVVISHSNPNEDQTKTRQIEGKYVHIQFLWEDRSQSSCWVRFAQLYGRAGEGFWQMPRVGSEVLVQFLEGNLDEPIIIGALYSKDNPTPFEKDFPNDKERRHVTGFRSASEKGKIYHELYWYDKSGSEYMKIAAPKLIQIISEDLKINTRNSIYFWTQNKFNILSQKEIKIAADSYLTLESFKRINMQNENNHLFLDLDHMYLKSQKGILSLEAKESIELRSGPSTLVISPSGISLTGPQLLCSPPFQIGSLPWHAYHNPNELEPIRGKAPGTLQTHNALLMMDFQQNQNGQMQKASPKEEPKERDFVFIARFFEISQEDPHYKNFEVTLILKKEDMKKEISRKFKKHALIRKEYIAVIFKVEEEYSSCDLKLDHHDGTNPYYSFEDHSFHKVFISQKEALQNQEWKSLLEEAKI